MKLCLRCNQYFDDPIDICPNDQIALENVGKDPLIGALINNRYLVDSVIGKGSSGIVYKARRLGHGEMVVAIKVLHSYIGAAGSALDRFLREAQAASRLRNPHIITIWESGVTEDGQPYFVMDYLEGTTLGHLIKDKCNLEPTRVIALLHQVCDALTEAHRLGIVHRDLKPENIVLQESDHGHDYVKLLDFGIADSPQHAQSSFKLEKPRTVSGSPAYMSPEQCQGLELDGRSDIYSLAIVVFEMLTGKRPFLQQENVNVMVLHVNEPPMTLAQTRPDLQFSAQVEAVIARALSKQPSQRQNTVQEFMQEFELAWAAGDNPVSVIKQMIVQPTVNKISQATEYSPRQDNDITSDNLAIQDGPNTKAAWGNVSMQSSTKGLMEPQNNSEIVDSPAKPSLISGVDIESTVNSWQPEYVAGDALVPDIQFTQADISEPTKPIDQNAIIAKTEQPNMSMEKPPSLAALFKLNTPDNIAQDNSSSDKPASLEIPKQGIVELFQPSSNENPVQSIDSSPSPNLPELVNPESQLIENNLPQPVLSDGEQSITAKNKTIERLLEAAKKGQTAVKPPKQKALIGEENLLTANANTARNPAFSQNRASSGPTASGWYPAMPDTDNPKAPVIEDLSVSQPTTSGLSSPLDLTKIEEASASNLASPISAPQTAKGVANYSAEPDSITAQQSAIPNSSVSELSRHYLQSVSMGTPAVTPPSIGPDLQATVRDISRPSLASLKNVPLAVQPEADKDEESGFFIKQKYRSTFSRIRGQQKPNRFDNSLVTTRARAASLKADTVKPPINLWHYAVGIVVAAALLACSYICYEALTVPIPPVTSIELLLKSGNYQQVIDILEGKSLSAPLDKDEIDQLSAGYLNLAKVELANDKPDEALTLLNKVDPKSASSVEANQLKPTIIPSKNFKPAKTTQLANPEKE